MLNYIWLALIVVSVVLGGWNNQLDEVTRLAFEGAKTAVMGVALPLVGPMCIWLGIMRLAERSGLVQILARALRPLLRWLFPDVPGDHPAMGSMVMNIASNMLGLGNAATPLGLRAMADLETLNRTPGTATNAMCTFLAINTSSVQLLPTGAIALLVAYGSHRPNAIVATSLLATACACVVGVSAAKFLEKLPAFAPPAPLPPTDRPANTPAAADTPPSAVLVPALKPGWNWALYGFAALAVGLLVRAWFFAPPPAGAGAMGFFQRGIASVSVLAVPCVLAFFPLYAAARGIKVYEEFVEGAKEGFQVALRVIPFLVTMLVAIGMFNGSGGMKLLTDFLRPALEAVGFPPDLLPMVLMRPLSGSGTQGLFVDLLKRFGADGLIPYTAGTIYGSTETTFYVVAVYFGSVAVRRTRHAILAGLLADATGVVVSVVLCRAMFGG